MVPAGPATFTIQLIVAVEKVVPGISFSVHLRRHGLRAILAVDAHKVRIRAGNALAAELEVQQIVRAIVIPAVDDVPALLLAFVCSSR